MISPSLKITISRFSLFIVLLIAFLQCCCGPLWSAIAPDRDVVILDNQDKSENPSWKKSWDQARKLSRDGKFPEAAEKYRELLGIKPNIEEAKWEYCKVLAEMKEWSEASILLEGLLEVDPNRYDYLLKAGIAALNNKQYEQAIKYFGQVYEKEPYGPFALEALKGFISGLQRLDKKINAFPLMEQLYLRTPNDFQLLQDLASYAQEFGWLDKARSYYATLVAKYKVDDQILLQAALVHDQAGMEDQALPYWLKYLERRPQYLPFQRKVAEYYTKRGKMSLALPHLLIISEKGGENDEILLQIGQIYFHDQKRPDKSLSFLERYLKTHPDDKIIEEEVGKLQAVLANDLLATVMNDGALMLWRDLAKITQNRQAIFLAIAEILEYQNKEKELFEVLEVIHSNNPSDKKIIWRLAEGYFNKKNYKKSYYYIKLLEGNEKDNPKFLILKAQIEDILGNEHTALLTYSKYLEKVPDDQQAREKSLELAGRLGMVKHLYALHEGIPKASIGSKHLSDLEETYIKGLTNNGLFSDVQNIYAELLKHRTGDTRKSAEIKLHQADSYFAEGLIFEAEQIARQVLAENLQVPEALKKLTRMAINGGDLTWAQTWFSLYSAKVAVNLQSKNYSEWPEEVFSLQLDLLESSQEYEKAIDMLTEYLVQLEKKTPENLLVIRTKMERRLCRLLYFAKNYERCAICIKEALVKNPDDIELLVILEKINDVHDGHKGRRDDILDSPLLKSFTNVLGAADLEYQYGSFDKGMSFVKRALKDIPGSVSARILEGKILTAKGEYGEAIEKFRVLSQEFPQQEYFNRKIIELEFKRGNFKKIVQEIPPESPDSSSSSSLADKSIKRNGSFWKRLILARSLWADGQWEAAIKVYQSLLIMPVDEQFLKKVEVGNVNFHLPPLKKSFWNLFTFTQQDNSDQMTAVMDPAFMGSHIGLPIDTIAADLYEKYRWQKLIESELSAKQAVQRRDYYQAEKEYKAIMKKGDSDEALYDLAKVYGRLELYGKEGEIYERIKNKGSEYPELDELVRQNTLKTMPRISMDYSFLEEKGRDGYIDVRKKTTGIEGWRMPAFNQEVEVRVDQNNYVSRQIPNETTSTRIIGAYSINFNDTVDTILSFGGNFPEGNGDANSLYKFQLKGRIAEYLSGNISTSQEIVEDTVQALKAGVYYRDYETGLKIDYFPRLFLGGDYRYREYSDTNTQNWYHFWTSYDLFSEESLLQLKYEYGTLENSKTNLGRDNDFLTKFLVGDLPYWSPDVYRQHLMTIRYKRTIEPENFLSAGKSYYTLDYSFGLENGSDRIDSVGFNIFLEMSTNFLFKGSLKYFSTDEYSLNAGMLSVIYRW
jgi:predicted Zn-dependent protease